VKRDIYIKVNTSLCPKKLLKALLKEKALFPTKVPAGRPFFGNKGPKKKSSNVSFPLFMLFMQTKSEFIENGSAIQVIGFFR